MLALLHIDGAGKIASWVALVGLALSGTTASAQAPPWLWPPAFQPPAVYLVSHQAPPAESHGFWIGVACRPVDDVLRAQLSLDQGGLIVYEVVAGSPAAEVDLRPTDILLKAGDALLVQVPDLIRAVEATGEAELTLTVLRDGKELTLDVTPAPRPHDRLLPPLPHDVMTFAPGNVHEMLERLRRGEDPYGPLGVRILGPGMVLPHELLKPEPLPDDVSVTIRKQGQQPAQVIVERGEQRWEVSEDALDQLPDELRGPVEAMMGRHVLRLKQGRLSQLPLKSFTRPPAAPRGAAPEVELPDEAAPPADAAPDGPRRRLRGDNLDDRLEQLRQDMERMRDSMRELEQRLREQRGPSRGSPKAI